MYSMLDTLSVVARAAYRAVNCVNRKQDMDICGKILTSLVFSAADLALPIAWSFVVPVCSPIVNIRGMAKVFVNVCLLSFSLVFSVTCSPVSIAEASPWPTDLLTYRPWK